MNVFRKALLGSTVLLVAGALAGPASADVFVTATIDKDKDKFVFEDIDQDVIVVLDVDVDATPGSAADAEAIVNQRNQGNVVTQQDTLTFATQGDGGGAGSNLLVASIADSVNGNSGDTKVNQDVGNMVNQANVLAFAVVTHGEGDATSYATAQASAEQVNGPNTVFMSSTTINASISGSINDNVGVAQVNQNAGNINNQLNSIAIAAGDDAVVALSEADLGQFNSGNSVTEVGVSRTVSMSGSVTGNSGVTQVNQSAGNMGNQGNVVAISGSF